MDGGGADRRGRELVIPFLLRFCSVLWDARNKVWGRRVRPATQLLKWNKKWPKESMSSMLRDFSQI